MKNLIILILVFANSACGRISSETASGILKPKVFAQELKADPDIVLIDVRSTAEMASGYLPGTRHLDFNAPGFKNSLDSLDRTRTYYLYCASGKRSGKALEMMKEMGFKNVAALEGGLRMWNASGLPIFQPNP